MSFIPEVYCLDGTLRSILREHYDFCEILWYHWPLDFIYECDYEPIICTYLDGTLVAITVRTGWHFQSTFLQETPLLSPIRISCDPVFHHPRVVSNSLEHYAIGNVMKPLNRRIFDISRRDISNRFRTGDKHPTNIKNKKFQDPFDYAVEIFRDLV